MEITVIQIHKETKSRLSKLGTVSSTYDSVLNELIDHYENCNEVKHHG
jgi:hypothetical protein